MGSGLFGFCFVLSRQLKVGALSCYLEGNRAQEDLVAQGHIALLVDIIQD